MRQLNIISNLSEYLSQCGCHLPLVFSKITPTKNNNSSDGFL